MVNKELTKHLAELSKISFTESEEEKITKEMNDIITLMDKVKSFNYNTPISSDNCIEYKNLREDICKSTDNTDTITSNAKCIKEGCFIVPKII